MSLLEVLQLVGYGTGASLTLWMGALLLRWRRGLGGLERVLFLLALAIGLWHTCNLALTLHALLGLEGASWSNALRVADTVALVSLIFAYSFLLHVHLYLWAHARSRPLNLTEKARVYLSYLPTLFLVRAIPQIWSGDYAPMLAKLGALRLLESFSVSYVEAFASWALYVLGLISATDLVIAQLSAEKGETRFMRTLAGSFLLIGLLIFAIYVLDIGSETMLGPYLATFANLGSLLPTALLAHRIYRHRYLDLVIRESLVVATFAAVVLIVYLFGIRALGVWMTERYSLRAGVIESLLILTLALVAQPLRVWLEKRFSKLFEREAKLYRELVARIGRQRGTFRQLPELLHFIEERIALDLPLRRVRLLVPAPTETSEAGGEATSLESDEALLRDVLERVTTADGASFESFGAARELGYALVYPLRREERVLGLMLVDAPDEALTNDVRAVLEVLAGQVAIAVEDCRLIEENMRLERRHAQDERLAALGQMAATVAHEVKNPLSAIKSIAQVMREDERLSEYERDLGLIVGETDRLNGSVTQLLSFARRAPENSIAARADELIHAQVELFRAQAEKIGVKIEARVESQAVLDGATASALRDALSNLLLNALQATAPGGRVRLEVQEASKALNISVTDTGAGIAQELRERIWEPFFSTKQRGTGLGLAIVRKRLEEIGGSIQLVWSRVGEGTRFELSAPLKEGR